MSSDFLNELKWRGILNNVTNEEKLIKAIKNNKAAYIGFDPTAKSLHLGNYVMIMLLRRFQQFGIKSYALIGGATGQIGDPSGKSSERNLLDLEKVNENKKHIIKQLKEYGKVEEVLDNYDNFKEMNVLDFLREVGKLINVNYMLEKDIIKTRLEVGISYTEFTYMLIQGYDFLKYYQTKNVAIQAGGSDQWGNITTGCEMIRKVVGDDNLACGITINLLLKSDGTKFGKSEKGAIFLDKNLTSPYEMYQFLINQEDKDVINLLKFLTLLTEQEINNLEEDLKQNPRERKAQKVLAELILTDIHGKSAFEQSLKISKSLFSDDFNSLSNDDWKQVYNTIPNFELEANSYSLVELLVKSSIAPSNREARQLISAGSIMVNGIKINDETKTFSNNDVISGNFTIIKKGKRNYFIIQWI